MDSRAMRARGKIEDRKPGIELLIGTNVFWVVLRKSRRLGSRFRTLHSMTRTNEIVIKFLKDIFARIFYNIWKRIN